MSAAAVTVQQGLEEPKEWLLEVYIPGEPKGQPRARSRVIQGRNGKAFASHYDPPEAKELKGAAQTHYKTALQAKGLGVPLFATGSIEVHIEAVFRLPQSAWRKTPVPRRPKVTKPDPDNVAKAYLDAANEVLWLDDCQVGKLVVERWVGAQGEAAHVVLRVRPWAPVAPRPMVYAPVVAEQRSLL